MNTPYSFFEQGGFFKTDCGVLCFSGEKAAVFLHGQLSNSIKTLKEGECGYNLLLTQKGKVRADLWVMRRQNDFYALVPERYLQLIHDHFAKLAPLSRVTIRDASAELEVWNVSGSYFLIPSIQKESFISEHEKSGLILLDEQAQEILRVEQGICKVGVDATEDNLPQESRLDSALHFEKGCYLGQEIIARLHYKGHVNKILVGLKTEKQLSLEAGKITSSIFSPTLGAFLALGYVPYKHEATMKIQGQTAQIVDLPLHF